MDDLGVMYQFLWSKFSYLIGKLNLQMVSTNNLMEVLAFVYINENIIPASVIIAHIFNWLSLCGRKASIFFCLVLRCN